MRKFIRYFFAAAVCVLLVLAVVFCNRSFPVITGYCAKTMCTEIFLARRDAPAISATDLGFFPVSLGHCSINLKDSSVTATVIGLWKQRAIFRQGIGSTLVHDISPDSLKKQENLFYHWHPVDRDSIDWPMGDRLNNIAQAGLNRNGINVAVDDFFEENDSAAKKHTRAVLLVCNGQLIAERYAPGYDRHSMFPGWSMGKTIGGALAGVLAKQGLLHADDLMAMNHWKQDVTDTRNRITCKNVLQQASGLSFEENYAKRSDVTEMLYLETDMGNFTAGHMPEHDPGHFFYYSSGNANLLSLKMRELLGEQAYHQLPYRQLLHRIGMFNTLPEPDGSGTFILSSYVYAAARDWARLGLLFLNKGRCNGEQVMDSNWVADSFQPAATDNFNHYGYQLWLNRGNDSSGNYRAFPSAPADMVYASGFQGQHVFIIPSKKLVVVRLGFSEKADYRADHSLRLLMDVLK